MISLKLSIIFTLLIALPLIASAESDVIALTSKNFDSVVFKSKVPVLVEFYAPWCKHCKDLAPTYEQVATNLKGLALVVKVDATVEEALGARFGIKGFPTLKIFKPGVTKGNTLEDYQSSRSARDLVNFVTSALNDKNIVKLKASNFESFFTSPPASLPRVILFSSKNEASGLYKSVSMRFKDQLVFGQVHQSDPLASQFGVQTFPHLIVLDAGKDDETIDAFEGKFNPDSLVEFLEKFASSASDSQKSENSQQTSNPTSTHSATHHHVPSASWKKAENWDGVTTECSSRWCVILYDPNGESIPSSVRDRVLALYGRDGKFHFVDASEETQVSTKFNFDASSPHWVAYNGKKQKYASLQVGDDALSSANTLLDRVIGGDAKLEKLN